MTGSAATWVSVVGVALTTLATRGSFVAFASRLKLHPLVEEALRFAPAAVLGALILPALVLRHGQFDVSPGNNQRLVAATIAALVMWRWRSMILTIAAGMATATALRLMA